ncbi:MAG TPA: acetyltransferase [Coleofasciculaceae cyanobacterium]|jgi:UDP-perosamine 4-acetyltransferase
MTIRVVMIGTGGHAQMMGAVCRQSCPELEIIAWLEAPGYEGGSQLMGLPVLVQSDTQIEALKKQGCAGFLFGIGSVKANPARWTIFEQLCQHGLEPLTLIHADASVSPEATVGRGVYIGAKAVIQPFARIGDACIINSGTIIEHDVTLEPNVHVAPGAVVCGQVSIGAHSLIGAGSTVIQGLKIGERVTIGAGSTVVRDVDDGQILVGSPAQPVAAMVRQV